ncbi:hypothetical protein HDF22_001537 [Mucilaginibacter lappiensis]|uniref:Phage integrase SAM-like domain-containing protein n=2 Tax=Mucilaginibacter lappiensis TaxID=354630 RepID=A0A841J8C0_9SPHI|nr:hypothetical protein [Mucilaginibacter lappiensis]
MNFKCVTKSYISCSLLILAVADDFFHYLTMQNIGDNTAMKYVKTLKHIIDRTIDEGWIHHNSIKGFKCSYFDVNIEILEMHQIVAMYYKPIIIKRLQKIRDVFIFCCFVGYAYETVYRLHKICHFFKSFIT